MPDYLHEIVVEIEVVDYRKPHAEHFAAFEQVAYVRARKIAAGGTVAMTVNGGGVKFIFSVVKIAYAFPCK
jgi:hypothetical protein